MVDNYTKLYTISIFDFNDQIDRTHKTIKQWGCVITDYSVEGDILG